jgi:hypothetical protein
MSSWGLATQTISLGAMKRLYGKPEEVLALCDSGLPIPLPKVCQRHGYIECGLNGAILLRKRPKLTQNMTRYFNF